MDLAERILEISDNNIDELRKRNPNGMHFVVGDLHGETATLAALMDKISFDPQKDHVYFVGDYNGGGDTVSLIKYLSEYYEPDYEKPGFHMIRGNHERELMPVYMLENLPDIIVVRGKNLVFYIVHAGMVNSAFRLINNDMFNIDSDIKGRCIYYETYRGLSCLCMEVYDELAGEEGILTIDKIKNAENGIFGQEIVYSSRKQESGNADRILKAEPRMKTIALDSFNNPILIE